MGSHNEFDSQEKTMNQICDKCNGKKFEVKLNLLSARSEKIKCTKCRGTGVIPASAVKDGIICFEQKCIDLFWQVKNDGIAISTLAIHICPVLDENGNPAFKVIPNENKLKSPTYKNRLFMEIVNMVTKPKFRKQGHMSKLLENAIADPKIEWVESSWDDSTSDGRNFLLGKGFMQSKDKLILIKGIGNATIDTEGPEQQSGD